MNGIDQGNRFTAGWHMILLAVIVFVFSLLSAGVAGGKILDWAAAEDENETIIQEESATILFPADSAEHEQKSTGFERKTARSAELIQRADQLINHLDRLWDRSIYKKAELSRIDSVLTYLTTGEIASSQVICGMNGWMFYKSPTDGNSMADYEGTNLYSEEELDGMLRTTLTTQEKAEKNGIQFAIIVPPNKENVYSEYMPKQYNHALVSSTDILIDRFRDAGVRISSPKTELIEWHNESQVYYSCDSHWNQLGGYIGVRTALKEWGIELPALSERIIISCPLKNCYHDAAVDDLARMTGLLSFFDNETEYIVEGTQLPDWQKYEDEQNQGRLSVYLNRKAKRDNTVMLIGDSFRTAMIPALCESFSKVCVIHRSAFRNEMLSAVQPDYLLLEYVERYSSEIEDIDFLFQ